MHSNEAANADPSARLRVVNSMLFEPISRFLTSLDCAAAVVLHSADLPLPTLLPSAEGEIGRLSPPDKREVERSVQLAKTNLTKRTEDLLNELEADGYSIEASPGLSSERVEVDRSVEYYPIAWEVFAAGMNELLREPSQAIMASLCERYSAQPGKLAYAVTLMTNDSRKQTLASIAGHAMLPEIIGRFKQCLGALARTLLSQEGDLLGDLPPIPGAIYEKYGRNVRTLDIDRWRIDRKVDEFVASDLAVIREDIKRLTGFDVASVGSAWRVINEAQERCNAYGRALDVADPAYLAALPEDYSPSPRLGDPISSDHPYIATVSANLAASAICAALAAAKRIGGFELSAFPFLIDRIVDLEERSRWIQAAAICEVALGAIVIPVSADLEADDAQAVTVRTLHVNFWFCQQERGMDTPELRQAIEVFEPRDDQEALARWVLLRDWRSLESYLSRKVKTDAVRVTTRREFNEMPLFRRAIHESESVRALLATPRAGRKTGRSKR